MPSWWDEAPRWEHREISNHYDSETDTLESKYIHRPVPLKKAIERRKRGEPLEYILGHCHVDNLTLKTDRRALIPRPETETLVRRFTKRVTQLPAGPLVDCGTGTGFMAGWLEEYTDRTVIATDRSEPALQLADENRRLNGWTFSLVKADIIRPLAGIAGVVANLPYVRRDSNRLSSAVEEFEPEEALFPPDSPVSFYRDAIVKIKDALISGGEVWLELEPDMVSPLLDWLDGRNRWSNVAVEKDESDRSRFLHLIKSPDPETPSC